MAKTVKDLEETPGYLEIAFDFGVEIMESGLIDPALYQALSDPETRKRVLLPIVQTMRRELFPEPAVASDSDDSPSLLPPNHYRVYVTYSPMPPMDGLKKKWGKDNVSVIFDGRPFTPHASCVGMSRVPGEYVFYLYDAGRGDWKSEERIAWGLEQRNEVAPNGYRPATHEETYEFAEAHPELANYVGLGSFALYGDRCVAHVRQYDGQRILDSYWFGGRWDRGARVLFVSRPA